MRIRVLQLFALMLISTMVAPTAVGAATDDGLMKVGDVEKAPVIDRIVPVQPPESEPEPLKPGHATYRSLEGPGLTMGEEARDKNELDSDLEEKEGFRTHPKPSLISR
ncbi:MAG: hypothetical protein R3296_11080 [Oleiphilaceae bacterium]|nr:hypothetical protein [Oleiphilaceae bacterium]